MLHEPLNKAEDAGIVTFSPVDYLLGLIQTAQTSRVNTLISLPGKGELLIFPARGAYFSSVPDLEEFCKTPATRFVTSAWNDSESNPFSGEKSLGELLWQAAFHASQGRLLEGCTRYDVVQLLRWPNLTRLPNSPNSARICALLTRHPTTIMLVHRILGISKEEVYQNYSAARCAGIANVKSSKPGAVADESEAADTPPEQTRERGLFRSLFAKISGL